MEILENISLKSDNTFGIDVIAKYYYTIDSAEAFIALSQTEIFQNNKYLLLGGGSNVLFTSDYDGLIIKNNLKGISIVEENNDLYESMLDKTTKSLEKILSNTGSTSKVQ